MKMNYNSWFYNQHKYLLSGKNNDVDYNDTKWIDINTRYKTLLDLSSSLLNEQPYGVVGNNKGFDKLIDLITRSNYTFEDIDESLISTYKMSLKNAMSNMLVNTQAVMFRCTNNDSKIVSVDKFTHYYVIDVPFNQLHFGDRDEFIRQQIHEMHTIENKHYVHMSDFVTSRISDILGFTILCTVNGFICNDCLIAIDDKGFKFKIGWPYSTDVEFIIYKLDETVVSAHVVDTNAIVGGKTIPYSLLNNINQKIKINNQKCLVNIYDKNFIKTVPSVPNFGLLTDKGLNIINLQKKTLTNITNNKSTQMTVVIYAFNYFHEVPNVYPAVNYYDIIDTRHVLTDDGLNISDVKGNTILSQDNENPNRLEKTTPPIVLDRPINLSFKTILSCMGLYDTMIRFESSFKAIGKVLNRSKLSYTMFVNEVVIPLRVIHKTLLKTYETYIQGAMLTSLVPSQSIAKFSKLLDDINAMTSVTNLKDIQKYVIDEYYDENYKFFVTTITSPFRNNILSNFSDLQTLSKNYFETENFNRFNRPVSEQCFITLKYNRTEGCWLFSLPNIKHFKGIGNSFYISDDLKGDEVFKFFVLYSDTDAPVDKTIEPFSMENIMDFDKFYDEAYKHIGYIKYWDVENKLMKITNLIYNTYDGETVVQVLSKILKRKLDAYDIIDVYPSDMNYELSNITTDGIPYDEDSNQAPFAINFLFYTLSMLNDNEDKLQTYFMKQLVDNKFNNRFSDINISEMLYEQQLFPINYSEYSLAPNMIDQQSSSFPGNIDSCIFYGLPLITNDTGAVTIVNPYRYVFNDYDSSIKHSMLYNNALSNEYYVKYSNPMSYGYIKYTFKKDIKLCSLLTKYLSTVYDYISNIQTNYVKTYNQISTIESGVESINTIIDTINTFYDNTQSFMHPDIVDIMSIINNNHIVQHLNGIGMVTASINRITYNQKVITTQEFFNSLISTLRQAYITTGFDNHVLKQTRALYIHLKKINTRMNIYEYKKWLMDIDLDLLQKLDSVVATNENYTLANNIFTRFSNALTAYRNDAVGYLNNLNTLVLQLSGSIFDTNLTPITVYCEDIINNYIFPMYVLKNIDYDNSISYSTKPHVLSVTISRDEHFYPPVGQPLVGNVTLIFKPRIEKVGEQYYIRNITKICEYVIFNDSPIECTFNIISEDGTVISTLDTTLNFQMVSSSSNDFDTFNQIPNIANTIIDVENIHESYDVDVNGMIINKKHADMNYEMLIGNNFSQLDHFSEEVLDVITKLPGPIDRVVINNDLINDFVNNEFSNNINNKVYFKPSQVIHLDVDDNDVMESVGGKYFVGQRLYLHTDDLLYVFPVIVTAIDHSANKGFIEAMVDDKLCKWFEVNDDILITKYLTSNVECTVIDDNVRNFLDEFNDSDKESYTNVLFNTSIEPSDDNFNDMYSLPGDPLYVQNNTNFVYTRLNWFFNDSVPNRFIDDEHKQWRFIYIGNGFISEENTDIRIKMINHDFNQLTNPEMYPVLREEPNDHDIWDKEIEVFNQQKYSSQAISVDLYRTKALLESDLMNAITDYDRNNIINQIDSIQKKINYEVDFQKRMDLCIAQLEQPTTWHSVRAYDSAMTYIQNGRAKIYPTFIPNIRDIPFNDKLQVFIYDWENKHWLDPSSYDITIDTVSGIKIDEFDDYKTNNVIHSITITPNDDMVSRKLLVYIAYNKSDIFDDIPMNDYECSVKFKPLLTLGNTENMPIPYNDIRVRKHFNGYEKYLFNTFNAPDDFSITNSFHIKRVQRNGRYTYSPTIRMCDLQVTNGSNMFDYEDFDLYMKFPFKDVSSHVEYKTPKYTVTINKPIQCFEPNQRVKLISIQNNQLSSYDGNISNVMFEALTSYDESDNPVLTIMNSSLPNIVTGRFICTVFKDESLYSSVGGVITVNVTSNKIDVVDDLNSWFIVPNPIYTEIQDECILVPKENVSIDFLDGVYIEFRNEYIKSTSDVIDINNQNTYNPFEYYYDTINRKRLPISDVRNNNNGDRLVVDTDINEHVKLIKSTYINVCRYSLQQIPSDGFINLTGYIPTPLSRNRYEFWVNGRNITNTPNLIILSPTSIQLQNLTSLRNFELIELVDDYDDTSIISGKGNVYIDLNGKTYSSYKLAMLSNTNIIKQDIRFMYNTNQHQQIHDYTKNILPLPNNVDTEADILDSVQLSEIDVPQTYPTASSLGITDIPDTKILDLFNKVWCVEQTINPLFPITHYDGLSMYDDEHLTLRVKYNEDSLTVYATGISPRYFTLYISKKSNGLIDDVANTILIIPFIKTGILVNVDKSYNGMWLHSTNPNCKPIRIKN